MRDRSLADRTCNRGISRIYWESGVKRRSSLPKAVLDRSQPRVASQNFDWENVQRRMMAMAMRIIRT